MTSFSAFLASLGWKVTSVQVTAQYSAPYMEKCHTREVKRQRREHRNNKNFILYREQKHKSQAITLMQLSGSNNQCVPFHPPPLPSLPFPLLKFVQHMQWEKNASHILLSLPARERVAKWNRKKPFRFFRAHQLKWYQQQQPEASAWQWREAGFFIWISWETCVCVWRDVVCMCDLLMLQKFGAIYEGKQNI